MNLLTNPLKLLLIAVFSILMTACTLTDSASSNNQKQSTSWQDHQNDLKQIVSFQATGSLAYLSNKTRYYGRFFINQVEPNQYQLRLTSPVGSPFFTLVVTPYLAELTDGEGKKYRDENVDRLMLRLTEMDMPLYALNSWFIGLSDDPTHDKVDAKGRLIKTNLSQRGQIWYLTINKYVGYKQANKKIDLPSSIEIIKQQDKLRLTIDNWKLN